MCFLFYKSRSQVVISGSAKGVEYAGSIIHSKGYAGRSVALPVSAPFHCSLMSDSAKKMKPALDKTEFREPVIEVISNVTGVPVCVLCTPLFDYFLWG